MKKIIRNILAFVFALISMVCVTGICDKQAFAVNYVDVTIDKSELDNSTDIAKTLQSYLDMARDEATDANVYRINIPKGTYNLNRGLKVYSNTYLNLKDVTLKRCTTNTGMLSIGMVSDSVNGYSGYNGNRNITIDGGTFDACGDVEAYKKNNCTLIRAAHAKNIVLKNVNLINGNNLHYIEVGGIDGFKMDGCSITGRESLNTVNTFKKEIEAVQFEILHTPDRMDNVYNYDDTPMKNVTINNCKFTNLQKGVGGHSMVIGSYFENINITNNTFTNLSKSAIAFENYRKVNISGNMVTNCGMGIDIKVMHGMEGLSEGEAKIYLPNDKSKAPVINPDAAMTISNNTISVNTTKHTNTPFAIRIFGEKINSNTANYAGINAGDYYIKNVVMSGNKITTKGIGIKLGNARYCTIKNNEINYTGGKAETSFYNICAYDRSTNLTISGNKITNAPKHGIYMVEGSGKAKITGNTIDGVQVMGINLYKCGSGNVISGNTVKNAGKDGIICEESSSTISKNKVYNTSRNGITVVHKTVATISGNTVDKVAHRGIMVDEGARATVSSNKVSKFGIYGIDVVTTSLSTKVKGNTISGGGKARIHVLAATNSNYRLFTTPKISKVSVSKRKITVKCNALDKGVRYIIYRREGNGRWKKLATTTKNTYIDKKVKKKKYYTYKVVAVANIKKVSLTSTTSKLSKKVRAK